MVNNRLKAEAQKRAGDVAKGKAAVAAAQQTATPGQMNNSVTPAPNPTTGVAPSPVTPGTGPGTAGAPVPTSTNTAAMDPTVAKQLALYNERLGADPSKRAIQTSTLGIQDAAALSAADAKGILARKGTLGSRAGDTFLQNKIFQPAQRQAAGAAAQIAQAEEARKDNLVLGGVPLAGLPGSQAIQNKNLALNQQGQAFNQAFQSNQANFDRAFQTQQAQAAADQRAQDNLFNIFQQTGQVPGSYGAGSVPVPKPYGFAGILG